MSRIGSSVAGGLIFSVTALLTFAAGVYATEDEAKPMPASATAAPVLSGDPELTSRVRNLSDLQQRVADGDKAALSEQLATARAIAQELARKPVSAWRDARDVRSIVKFVLSGGDPAVLGRLVDSASLPEAKLPLARGVVAYARGQRAEADKLLGDVDHRLLGSSLAGHVALVKAVIASQSSTSQALGLCREAMLLSPGTHIEEAALRLLISIATTSGDATSVERAHVRHLLRFPNSLYARDIDARVSKILVANADGAAIEIKAISELPELMPPPRRRAFFAQLAEAALRAGKPEMAIRAARVALLPPHPAPETDAETTATLLAIEGAALVLTADRKDGLRRLAEARQAGPSVEISDLIAEAQGLVRMIEAPPVPSAGIAREVPAASATLNSARASAGATSASGMPAPAIAHYQAVLSRGEAALETAEQLIEQAAK